MYLTAEQNKLSRRCGRASVLLLLVAAFVFSQSLAQAHVHADGELNATCVVCHHADNSPALLPLATQVQLANSATFPSQAVRSVALPAQAQNNYHSRAPPSIQ